jgi:hypothetical protein
VREATRAKRGQVAWMPRSQSPWGRQMNKATLTVAFLFVVFKGSDLNLKVRHKIIWNDFEQQ